MREGLPIIPQQTEASRESLLPHKRIVRDYAMPQVENAPEHERRESIVLMGKQEKVLFRHFYRTLPETHEVVREISAIFEEVAKVISVSIDGYRVVVYESLAPDAHVQLYGKELRISSACLEAIEGDRDLLRAIIAHEVGHVLLKHDDEVEKRQGQDEERPFWDPLQDRVMSYEAEYQADRTSAFALHRLDRDPSEMRRSLARLDAYIQKIMEHEEDLSDFTVSCSWFLETHPHITRRTIALLRLERLLDKPSLNQGDASNALRLSSKDFSPLFVETMGTVQGIWIAIKGEERSRIRREKAKKRIEEEEKREKKRTSNEKIGSVLDAVILQESKETFDRYLEGSKKELFTIHSVDCFWDEREPIQLPEEELHGTKIKWTFDPVILKDWVVSEQAEQPLDYFPEEVNAFTDKHRKEIRSWWDQAMGLVIAKDGLQDILADCAGYSLEGIKRLLRFCEPIRYHHSVNSDLSGLPLEFYKELDFTVMLQGGYDYHADELSNFSIEIFFLSSLLIREWFKKQANIVSIEGVTDVLTFLREFRMQHGCYFPYDQARIFDLCANLFSKAATDAEKTVLVQLFDAHGDELMRGAPKMLRVASVLMKSIFDWIKTQPPLTLRSGFFEGESFMKVSALETDLQELAAEKQTTKEQCRDALARTKGQFDQVNWSKRIAEVSRSLWQEYHKAEGGRVAGSGAMLDRMREEDPTVAALLLTTKEFEDAYFGDGRERYTSSAYAALDDHVALYRSVAQLWERAGYREEITARTSSHDQLVALLETFPVACAKRDQLCIEFIGWGELKNVEDVLTLQERFIAGNKDIPLLFMLSQGFTNSFLRIACAQRLWELYKEDANQFFASVPSTDQKRVDEALHGMHPVTTGERLRAIILCYPDPSYLRDDLLRPLIDAAPSEATTLDLASFLAEPPPGVVRRRTSTMVTTSESILDAARDMKPIDKKEIILYLLGHRTFYSGIDAQFEGTRTGHEDQYREVLLLEGAKAFERAAGESVKSSPYVVKKPDALVLLGKYSGAPLDLLVQQERFTTTRREEADLLYFVLLGPYGVLREAGKERFLRRAAGTIVRKGEFAKELPKEEKKAIIDLLAFALANCPEEKIPNLFLDLWYISREAKKSLPDLTASLFREYGPVFIKAGQYLATQTATLPPEWTTAFRALSDKNRAVDKTLLYEYEYREYGEDSPFALVGKKAGEGSMAAVYEGKLLDGKRVAAKVIHPFIEREIEQDTKFLDAIVHFVNEHSQDYGGVRLPQNLAEVTRRHMLQEIDTKREAAQAKELASILSPEIDDVHFSVPPVYEQESRGRFLVAAYGDGVSTDNDAALAAQGIDAKKVRQSVALEVLRQVIAVGVYQADTNPGNFAVTKRLDGKPLVHWFDTGHIGRLTEGDRTLLKDLIRGMLLGTDTEAIADIFTAMTEIPEGISRDEVSTWVSDWCSKQLVGFRDMGDMQKIFTGLFDFYTEKKLVLKEQWVVLLRTLGLLQPMLRDTDPARLQEFLAPHLFSEIQ